MLSTTSLLCPWNYHLNCQLPQLKLHTLSWAIHFDLFINEASLERFIKSKFPWLMSACYPDCQLEELKLACDWISFILIWDDACDMSDFGSDYRKLKICHQRFINILKGTELASSDMQIVKALADMRDRMLLIADTNWYKYFVQSIERYLDGLEAESRNRAFGVVPTVKDYISLRRLTGAMEPLIELIIFCNHLQISDDVRESSNFKELVDITNDSVCWNNDIQSAWRESQSNEVHNLVLLLSHHHQIPIEEAIERAVEMHNNRIKRMLVIEKNLEEKGESANEDFCRFIQGMQNWISGSVEWYSHSHRYSDSQRLELCNL
jgi:5-epi-alpha-selinene synthase